MNEKKESIRYGKILITIFPAEKSQQTAQPRVRMLLFLQKSPFPTEKPQHPAQPQVRMLLFLQKSLGIQHSIRSECSFSYRKASASSTASGQNAPFPTKKPQYPAQPQVKMLFTTKKPQHPAQPQVRMLIFLQKSPFPTEQPQHPAQPRGQNAHFPTEKPFSYRKASASSTASGQIAPLMALKLVLWACD